MKAIDQEKGIEAGGPRKKKKSIPSIRPKMTVSGSSTAFEAFMLKVEEWWADCGDDYYNPLSAGVL